MPKQLQMLSATGLLPCPFCKSVQLSHVAKQATEEEPQRFLFLQCEACGATGPHGESREQQRALWGVREEVRSNDKSISTCNETAKPEETT